MSTTCTCGCCDGPRKSTPASTWNAPRQAALQRRAGTYASFLESMRAELSSNARPGLSGLRTRSQSDPAVAFADAWAVVADVLTFYQERLANEGYLRTATERLSVVEIANLIGYRPRPGVAATVHLAYTLDEKSVPVEIGAGSKAQNVPEPGEQMQTFETAEPLQARVEWNELKPRLTIPTTITLPGAFLIKRIRLAGSNLDIRPGAPMLLAFVDRGQPTRVDHVLRRVAASTPLFELGFTDVDLQPRPRIDAPAMKRFAEIHDLALSTLGGSLDAPAVVKLMRGFSQYLLGAELEEVQMYASIAADTGNLAVRALALSLGNWASALLGSALPAAQPAVNADPHTFIPLLDRAPVRVASSAANLARSVTETFTATSDAGPRLLTRVRPRMSDTYFRVWKNLPPVKAAVTPTADPVPVPKAPYAALTLDGIHVLRNMSGLFGSLAPQTIIEGGTTKPFNPDLDFADGASVISLESVDEAVAPGSLILLNAWASSVAPRMVGVVHGPHVLQRASYLIQGKSTRFQLLTPGTLEELKWRSETFGSGDTKLAVVRSALAFVRGERLELAQSPDLSDVKGATVSLGTLYDGLEAGRWLIIVGERTDLVADGASVQGIEGRELMMLSSVNHDADVGETPHTTITFERPLANSYKRGTVRIFANVVKATHGETQEEALGSGNAAQTLQTFALKRDPLTYVPAATPDGIQTTLEARVNLVRWGEIDSLAVAGPSERRYVVRINEDGGTALTFGTGEHGARLPTGTANVRAKYRSGIGKPGNVKADSITLLTSRPLGVRDVINPLRSSGGAGAESRNHIRTNAPLAVAALDRLVGVRDYADFARTFAGIGHADATALSDGVRQVVHITVAGIDDIPIDEGSDLLKALLEALRRFGDPMLPVRVKPRELLALVVSAGITIDPDYLWDDVDHRVRDALRETFSFSKRTLARPAYLSEAIAAIQSVRGVVAVDVDVFDAVSEQELSDQALLNKKIEQLTGGNPDVPQPRPMVPALPARLATPNDISASPERSILPAQLAFLLPDVADTVILNRR